MYQENLPKLVDLAEMKIDTVNNWIARIPHSAYYRLPRRVIVNELNYNEAIRYLAELIILNERLKSNLGQVIEADSAEEFSQYIHSLQNSVKRDHDLRASHNSFIKSLVNSGSVPNPMIENLPKHPKKSARRKFHSTTKILDGLGNIKTDKSGT